MTHHAPVRLDDTAPRYTSYPTAPHFHAGVDGAMQKVWLESLPEATDLSLYVHIPFCDRLCWFCACHTKQTHRYAPVEAYLSVLKEEIRVAGGLVRDRAKVRALHLGGGSPTMLRPVDMIALTAAIRTAFDVAPDVSISVEIDPNDMDEDRLDGLAAIGMTRASLGIQDFDPIVQKAINREQSFETTARVIEGLRSRGVGSVNLDLLYGLPHQTRDSLESTLQKSLSLAPDRIALFGYAHVPWFKKHQTMIDEKTLPGAAERLEQADHARGLIIGAGYDPIGIDHFSRPSDGLSLAAREHRLRRNFQGYTDDGCEVLLGLGPSSVSQMPQGYFQNTPATGDYMRRIRQTGLAAVRGVELTDDDHMRRWIIERLMCDFSVSADELAARFGTHARPVLEAAGTIDGLCEWQDGRLTILPAGRALTRSIAARFDTYLANGKARHSATV